jgi:hypothetical protein
VAVKYFSGIKIKMSSASAIPVVDTSFHQLKFLQKDTLRNLKEPPGIGESPLI